jgi:hypothetical protein
MQLAKISIISLLACAAAIACGAADVKLEANARWSLEFPELPDTLATTATGQRQPARLTAQLPANYSRVGKFPVFVFLNGGDGGRGDTLLLHRQTVGSNDFICVVGLAGCASATVQHPSRVAEHSGVPSSATPTILSEADALRIGNRLAEEEGWELRKHPTRARFVASQGEWQIFFHVKNHGGPFIVYVSDMSGVARYIVGE